MKKDIKYLYSTNIEFYKKSVELLAFTFAKRQHETFNEKSFEQYLEEEQKYFREKGPILVKFTEETKRSYYYYCAFLDNKIVGIIIWFKYIQENMVWVDVLAVDEECRRIGIGSNLIYSIFKENKEVDEIRLRTAYFNNAGAITFYEKLGFERVLMAEWGIEFSLKRKNVLKI